MARPTCSRTAGWRASSGNGASQPMSLRQPAALSHASMPIHWRVSPAMMAACRAGGGGGGAAAPGPPPRAPGPGGGLEAPARTAAAHPARGRFGRVDKAHGVARLVIAVLVERRAREIGPFPVAGRHVRAAYAHFELVADRHELEFDAGDRHADRTRALDHEVRGG